MDNSIYNHKLKSYGSDRNNQSIEELFVKIAKDKGWVIIAANKKQYYCDLWDYIIRKQEIVCYIKIKGLKKLNITEELDDSKICIELMTNIGYPGWLYGKSTHIAFLLKEGFVLVDRNKLVQKVESLVNINSKPINSVYDKQLHIIYRKESFGHKDKIVYITKKELLSIQHKIWERQ